VTAKGTIILSPGDEQNQSLVIPRPVPVKMKTRTDFTGV